MNNFQYHNPVRIIFGKGQISQLSKQIPADARIMLTYGGGSIFKNGVYDQVKAALAGRQVIEFGGIEANPTYETLMQGVAIARAEKIDFLLSVGGGSVLDYYRCSPWRSANPACYGLGDELLRRH
jgi:NADP-dependent alcohol dehydrogenase